MRLIGRGHGAFIKAYFEHVMFGFTVLYDTGTGDVWLDDGTRMQAVIQTRIAAVASLKFDAKPQRHLWEMDQWVLHTPADDVYSRTVAWASKQIELALLGAPPEVACSQKQTLSATKSWRNDTLRRLPSWWRRLGESMSPLTRASRFSWTKGSMNRLQPGFYARRRR